MHQNSSQIGKPMVNFFSPVAADVRRLTSSPPITSDNLGPQVPIGTDSLRYTRSRSAAIGTCRLLAEAIGTKNAVSNSTTQTNRSNRSTNGKLCSSQPQNQKSKMKALSLKFLACFSLFQLPSTSALAPGWLSGLQRPIWPMTVLGF